MSKSAEQLLSAYAETRDLRDRLRDERNGRLCKRAEGVTFIDGIPEPRSGTPCWKAARQWESADNPAPDPSVTFWLDPPLESWCDDCRERQAAADQLRVAVRHHAAAKRAVLRRGRALVAALSSAEASR